MFYFKVEIDNKTYFIEFKNEDKQFKKSSNIFIINYHTYTTLWGKIKEDIQILEKKIIFALEDVFIILLFV